MKTAFFMKEITLDTDSINDNFNNSQYDFSENLFDISQISQEYTIGDIVYRKACIDTDYYHSYKFPSTNDTVLLIEPIVNGIIKSSNSVNFMLKDPAFQKCTYSTFMESPLADSYFVTIYIIPETVHNLIDIAKKIILNICYPMNCINNHAEVRSIKNKVEIMDKISSMLCYDNVIVFNTTKMMIENF